MDTAAWLARVQRQAPMLFRLRMLKNRLQHSMRRKLSVVKAMLLHGTRL